MRRPVRIALLGATALASVSVMTAASLAVPAVGSGSRALEGAGQLLEELALLVGQLLRHGDSNSDLLVATAVPAHAVTISQTIEQRSVQVSVADCTASTHIGAQCRAFEINSAYAKNKVGTVTAKQVEDIAKTKMPDLNCDSLESAIKTVAGTARSMGLDVVG